MKCLRCGDIIESKTRHDFVSCSCGAIFTDGGHDYIRRGFAPDVSINDYIDFTEIEEVNDERDAY